MNYRLRFGSYDLPTTLRPGGEDRTYNDGAVPRLRESGSVTRDARHTETALPVAGEIAYSDLSSFLTARDAIVAACGPSKQDFWFGRDDRYYKNVQLASVSVSYPEEGTTFGVYAVLSLTFKASEYPEAFGTTADTPALSSTGGTFTAPGDAGAMALPTWTITINAGGSGPLTLINTTTGETCIVKKPDSSDFSGGDVIVLDRDTFTAKLNGTIVPGLFDRRIPKVQCGVSNTITLTRGGTATIASLAVSYLPRFR